MRSILSSLLAAALLLSSAARAQSTDTPSDPEATQEVPPEAVGPAESPGERALRYSRFSAGAGGPLFIFSEVVTGIVTGAMVGAAIDPPNDGDNDPRNNGAYAGGVLGGLGLGTAAALYQYWQPVEMTEAALAAGGALTGFLAGLGAADAANWNATGFAVAALLGSQLGVGAALAATFGEGEPSGGDTALVGMTSLYATALTGLVMWAAESDTAFPLLFAPAAGMLAGGLLTGFFELPVNRVFTLTVLPLGMGLVSMYLGGLLATGATVPITTLGVIAATFAITALVTAPADGNAPPTRKEAKRQPVAGLRLTPAPVVMATGPGGKTLTTGPGLVGIF